jgi:hypothetical protein
MARPGALLGGNLAACKLLTLGEGMLLGLAYGRGLHINTFE